MIQNSDDENCLIWLHLVSVIMTDCAPLITYKVSLGTHQSLALWPCCSSGGQRGSYYSGFAGRVLSVTVWQPEAAHEAALVIASVEPFVHYPVVGMIINVACDCACLEVRSRYMPMCSFFCDLY